MTYIIAPFEVIAYKKGREEGIRNFSRSNIIEILESRVGTVPDEVIKKSKNWIISQFLNHY